MVRVRTNQLNAWPVRRILENAVRNSIMAALVMLVSILGVVKYSLPGLSSEVAFLWLALAAATFFALLIARISLRRNETLVRWGRDGGFDFLFRIQRLASHLRSVLLGLSVSFALLFWVFNSILHRLNADSAVFWGLVVAVIWPMWGSYVAELFTGVFVEPAFSTLCLRNFAAGVKKKRDVRARHAQLFQGLKTVESTLAKYSVRIPRETLAFAINMGLIKGISVDDPLSNLVTMIQHPTHRNVATAVNSCEPILKSARKDLTLGMEIPLPFWRRFLVPPYLAFIGNIISFVIFLATTTLFLLGFRF